MNIAELEKEMRSLEFFRSLRMLPGVWGIIRVDGRGFRRYTEGRFDKPFDIRFRDLMAKASQALLEDLQASYAYMMSDEISLVLPPDWSLFDRRVEKVVSVSAGLASSVFTLAANAPVHFDSRVWLGADVSKVIDYFVWRQAEASRNALHGWCYWTLRNTGKSADQASRILHNRPISFQNELLFQHGINFNDLPLWQRRGVGLYRESYEKPGYNPKDRKKTTTTRNRTRINLELPMKGDYRDFLQKVIEA